MPDFGLLEGVVADGILMAAKVASRRLRELGIPHMLVGGLAVGAHGYVRATKDVDFVVGPEAYEYHALGIVSVVHGVPVKVGGVVVDPILPSEKEGHLFDSIASATESHGVPIAPLEALLYMKLSSPRRKDAADVVELMRARHRSGSVRDLREHIEGVAPWLVGKFDELSGEAGLE